MFDSDKHWKLGFLLKLPVAEMEVSAILTQKITSIFLKYIYCKFSLFSLYRDVFNAITG